MSALEILFDAGCSARTIVGHSLGWDEARAKELGPNEHLRQCAPCRMGLDHQDQIAVAGVANEILRRWPRNTYTDPDELPAVIGDGQLATVRAVLISAATAAMMAERARAVKIAERASAAHAENFVHASRHQDFTSANYASVGEGTAERIKRKIEKKG